jgi:acetolactate synthase-1/2/3 large subunit
VVAGFGAKGLEVRRADELRPALARAREWVRQGHAVLLNVWLDKTEFREGSLSM